jgi:hypothetical protein
MLCMNNSGIKAVQFLGNVDQSQYEGVSSVCLGGQTE